jgi:hypothetical protein
MVPPLVSQAGYSALLELMLHPIDGRSTSFSYAYHLLGLGVHFRRW